MLALSITLAVALTTGWTVSLVFLTRLFLSLSENQRSMISTLTSTNQSLLNQVRAKDMSSLMGLQQATGTIVGVEEDPYMTVDDREMAAYRQAMSQVPVGEVIYDEEIQEMVDDLR